MQKTVYYSKKYMNKRDLTPAQEAAVARLAKRRQTRMGVLMIVVCLLVAVTMVLLVPMLVGGAPPSSSQVEAIVKAQNIASFATPSEARSFLGINAALPTALPEGYGVTGSRVVDGSVIEIELTDGKNGLLFRTAEGNDDLSGMDYEAFSYTATETVDDIARGYAGVSDKKLSMAVWAYGDYTYSLVTDGGGIDAAQLKLIAESVY